MNRRTDANLDSSSHGPMTRKQPAKIASASPVGGRGLHQAAREHQEVVRARERRAVEVDQVETDPVAAPGGGAGLERALGGGAHVAVGVALGEGGERALGRRGGGEREGG